jgi:tetratricopeptide (TPR) repeat protein
MGRNTQAEAAYRRALAIRTKLVNDFPTVAQYRQYLANCLNNLGNLLAEQGKRAEAVKAYRQALALQDKLAADFPAIPEYRRDLALTHNNLATLLDDLDKRAEAEKGYRQALAIQEKLAADFPNVPEYRRELAGSHGNLSTLLAVLGKHAEAEAAQQQVLAIRETLVADFPAVPHYRVDLGGAQIDFGTLKRMNRQLERALPWYAKGIATLEAVPGEAKNAATAGRFLRVAHLQRAGTLDELKRFAEAAIDWERVAELTPEAEQSPFRMHRALSLVRAGDVELAIREAEDLANSTEPGVLYSAACVLALASERRSSDSAKKDSAARRALALLRQAVARGWKDAEQMKKDDNLKALRGRADFTKLVAGLEAANAKNP